MSYEPFKYDETKPEYNPMCKEWGERLWVNNPAPCDGLCNPYCFGWSDAVRENNPTRDYRFLQYVTRA